MRSKLLSLAFGGLLVFAAGGAAQATDIIDSYNFQGTLAQSVEGGTSVTGQFSFDFTNNTITSFQFTAPGDTISPGSAVVSPFTGTSPTGSFLLLSFFGDSTLDLVVNPTITQFFEIPIFVGGGIGGNQSTYTCQSVACSLSVNTQSTFASGSISPVPEPASLVILGTALAGLGLIRRRRKTL